MREPTQTSIFHLQQSPCTHPHPLQPLRKNAIVLLPKSKRQSSPPCALRACALRISPPPISFRFSVSKPSTTPRHVKSPVSYLPPLPLHFLLPSLPGLDLHLPSFFFFFFLFFLGEGEGALPLQLFLPSSIYPPTLHRKHFVSTAFPDFPNLHSMFTSPSPCHLPHLFLGEIHIPTRPLSKRHSSCSNVLRRHTLLMRVIAPQCSVLFLPPLHISSSPFLLPLLTPSSDLFLEDRLHPRARFHTGLVSLPGVLCDLDVRVRHSVVFFASRANAHLC